MEPRQTASTADKLEQLQTIISRLRDAEMELRYRLQVPVDDYFYKKIDEWASKILGVSLGYDNEFKIMYQHRVVKYRQLIGGHADITVGAEGDLFAKSIQSKSTISDFSAVNYMIKEAFNQLAGERGEHPRNHDRLVVSMVINNPNNTWPRGSNTLGTMTIPEFKEEAISKIKELALTYRPHESAKKPGFGLNQATFNSLTDVQNVQVTPINRFPYMGHPNSTQLIAHKHGLHPSQGDKVIHLTIKIQYLQGFPLKVGMTFDQPGGTPKYIFLHKAVFSGKRIGNQLVVTLDKLITFDGNGLHKAYL